MKRNEAILELDVDRNAGRSAANGDALLRNEPKVHPQLAPTLPRQLPGVVIGVLKGFNGNGVPLVAFAGSIAADSYGARTTIELAEKNIGSEVALVFEDADRRKPIILGVILNPAVRTPAAGGVVRPVEVKLDGRQVRLAADQEIVLSCGKASITLTRAGKVLINGEYLLSRSVGVNRIKGGSVQIN